LAIPNLYNLFTPESTARNRWVGIINPTSINLINESRRLFEGPKYLNVLLNNKVVYFTKTFLTNYLNLFNPVPLFFQGSQNLQFNPPGTGLLFVIFLPFFYIGLLKIFLSSKNRLLYLKWLLVLIVLLLPSALTVGDFPSIRATSALPLYFLFIAIGLHQLDLKKFKSIYILVVLISVLEFINYSKQYLQYSRNYAFTWQYGYQQAVQFVRNNYDQYSHIYFTKKYGEPHEFVLFYWPWDPSKYLSDPNLKWNFHSDWYWVDSFDKFTFLNDWEIPTQSFEPNSLLITSPNNFPKTGTYFQNRSINFPDGTTAFDIISYD
jgi:hypothetical protein